MLIRKDKPFFYLPETVAYGQPDFFGLYPLGDPETTPGSFLHILNQIPYKDLRDLQSEKPLAGVPCYFALDRNCKRLEFYPTPDKDYYARFRYAPALKEI